LDFAISAKLSWALERAGNSFGSLGVLIMKFISGAKWVLETQP